MINMSEKNQPSNVPTVIDLFSGAGGFSLAALHCDLNVLAAVELDRDACQTYRNNIIANRTPTTRLYEKDILALSGTQLREDLKLKPGELDILIGGPPCQGFSTHRINDKGVNDPRNKLLLRYFDFVKTLQPRLFLVENVPGLLWPRHAGYLEKFQRAAQENGYTMLPPVRLNARDYGVPQNRERVFLLGIRADIDAAALVWPPAPTHFAPNSSRQAVWQNAAVAFEPPSSTEADKLLQALVPDVAGTGARKADATPIWPTRAQPGARCVRRTHAPHTRLTGALCANARERQPHRHCLSANLPQKRLPRTQRWLWQNPAGATGANHYHRML